MDNESIHSESEFYLYHEEQDKYGLFVFSISTRDITSSINFSYTAERQPAFFMIWKFLFILRGKNKYVIHRPGSIRIGTSRPVNNIYILQALINWDTKNPCDKAGNNFILSLRSFPLTIKVVRLTLLGRVKSVKVALGNESDKDDSFTPDSSKSKIGKIPKIIQTG